MDKERDIREQSFQLQFMYNKISVPKMALSYWMTIPEFVEEMLRMLSNSETIDNKSVYLVMDGLYRDMERYRKTPKGQHINYRLARSAVNALKRELSIE